MCLDSLDSESDESTDSDYSDADCDGVEFGEPRCCWLEPAPGPKGRDETEDQEDFEPPRLPEHASHRLYVRYEAFFQH